MVRWIHDKIFNILYRGENSRQLKICNAAEESLHLLE